MPFFKNLPVKLWTCQGKNADYPSESPNERPGCRVTSRSRRLDLVPETSSVHG